MRHTRTLLLTIAASALLAGCGDTAKLKFLEHEAGASLDEGQFGNPTMNNLLVQNGEKQVIVDLSQRFADEVPTTINFAFNSTKLDTQARNTLRQQASWIRQFPEIRFRVYGHTDMVGTDAYNERLGLRRANVVVNYLVSQGISRSRLEAVTSLGETQPLIVSQGRERRNRRTVTDVSGFVTRAGQELDGQYAALIYRAYTQGTVISSEQATTTAPQ